MFDPGPCVYMEKLAGGRRPRRPARPRPADGRDAGARGRAPRRATSATSWSSSSTAPATRRASRSSATAGARVRLITDGDVSASLLAVSDRSPVDLLWGIGGTPEGVISAAAIKCIGGGLVGRLWPRDEEERSAAIDAGYDLDRELTQDDLVRGDDCFFSATGVTDGDVLEGVRYEGAAATTESLVMRSRSGTVRRVQARTTAPSCAPSPASATAERCARGRSATAAWGPAPRRRRRSARPWSPRGRGARGSAGSRA